MPARPLAAGGSFWDGEISLGLAPTVDAAAEARRWLSPLRSELGDARWGDLQLIVTELVTNCVRHAGLGPDDSIDVRLALTDSQLWVEVSDSGPGFDPAEVEAPSDDRDGGRGLLFVHDLADDWGVAPDSPPTTVWCVLERPRAPVPVHAVAWPARAG